MKAHKASDFHAVAPADWEPQQFHKLLLSLIIPRPIGFISTMSADGVPNLAPFSFFQAVSSSPPALLFCPNRNRFGQAKHSLLNAAATREFVANTVTMDMAEAMNLASGEYPEGVSEFHKAGFTPLPSDLVKPLRVAESPVNFECRVIQVVELSDKPLGGSVVIGEIVRVHLLSSIYDHESATVERQRYPVISRLGREDYGLIGETFQMPRPKMSPDGSEVQEGSHHIVKWNTKE